MDDETTEETPVLLKKTALAKIWLDYGITNTTVIEKFGIEESEYDEEYLISEYISYIYRCLNNTLWIAPGSPIGFIHFGDTIISVGRIMAIEVDIADGWEF